MKRHTQKEELDREVKKLNNQLKNDKAKFDTFSNPVLTGNDAKRFREMFLNDGKPDPEKAKRNEEDIKLYRNTRVIRGDIPKTDKYEIDYMPGDVFVKLYSSKNINIKEIKEALSSVPDDFILSGPDTFLVAMHFVSENKKNGT